jgi:hypothetical protein
MRKMVMTGTFDINIVLYVRVTTSRDTPDRRKG